MIREGAHAQSAKVGNLAEGEVFEVLEEISMPDGQRRIRMERGWVSLTAKSGKPLCVGEAAVQLLLPDLLLGPYSAQNQYRPYGQSVRPHLQNRDVSSDQLFHIQHRQRFAHTGFSANSQSSRSILSGWPKSAAVGAP